MTHLIANQFKVLVLLIASIASYDCLHSLTKRYQVAPIDHKSGGPSDQRTVRDSILDRFRINANTIIRTHDSRALGAKYLNETELASNEDCLYWCWQTSPCNLAVYEQKTRGSCYLFDCGSSEDFRCKFTAHNFYSSSILQVNRHPYDLSQWGSQVQHEKELTKLRSNGPVGPTYVEMTASPPTKSSTPANRIIGPMVPAPPMISPTSKSLIPKSSHCLHFQFECRNNSECIAIYNVCDGIPQCSDGSDEAIDLECHKSRFNVPNPRAGQPVRQIPEITSQALNNQKPQKSEKLEYPRVSDSKSAQALPVYNYPKTANSDANHPNEVTDERTASAKKPNYMTADESNVKNGYGSQYRGPWNAYYPQNEGYTGSNDNRGSGGSGGSGGGYLVEPEYMNVYNNRDNTMNSGSYWPSTGRQQYDLSEPVLSPGGQTYMGNKSPNNAMDEWSQTNPNGYEPNYYERMSKTRGNSNTNSYAQQMSSDLKSFSTSKANSDQKTSKSQEQSMKAKMQNKTNVSYSHISSNRGYAKSGGVIAVTYMHDTSQQSGRETNSAVIALSLGLLVTALLIVLVGCRMKSFKRKIARRGRPLAHDADYLVNGMYL